MARPLDGIVFQACVLRLGFSQEIQELLVRIRTSPSSRTPGARYGNMPVLYPSKKRQCIIKAETRSNRYQLDEHGVWRYPPGETFAAYDSHSIIRMKPAIGSIAFCLSLLGS